MKKILKIIGYTLAGLILIFIIAALLIRFVFKEQMIAYTSKLEETERIELLRNATPYASDTAHYHFSRTPTKRNIPKNAMPSPFGNIPAP